MHYRVPQEIRIKTPPLMEVSLGHRDLAAFFSDFRGLRDDELDLPSPVSRRPDQLVHFVVRTADGAVALEGTGEVELCVDLGRSMPAEERYEVTLRVSRLDETSKIVVERLRMARAEAESAREDEKLWALRLMAELEGAVEAPSDSDVVGLDPPSAPAPPAPMAMTPAPVAPAPPAPMAMTPAPVARAPVAPIATRALVVAPPSPTVPTPRLPPIGVPLPTRRGAAPAAPAGRRSATTRDPAAARVTGARTPAPETATRLPGRTRAATPPASSLAARAPTSATRGRAPAPRVPAGAPLVSPAPLSVLPRAVASRAPSSTPVVTVASVPAPGLERGVPLAARPSPAGARQGRKRTSPGVGTHGAAPIRPVGKAVQSQAPIEATPRPGPAPRPALAGRPGAKSPARMDAARGRDVIERPVLSVGDPSPIHRNAASPERATARRPEAPPATATASTGEPTPPTAHPAPEPARRPLVPRPRQQTLPGAGTVALRAPDLRAWPATRRADGRR